MKPQPLFPEIEEQPVVEVNENGVRTRVWDISESISELAYLTHNFFRYYGKFPSVLAKNVIQDFALPDHIILDTYAGSGTSLVEAKLAGYNSVGVDINPMAVLACKVKCRNYSLKTLDNKWQELRHLLEDHHAFLSAYEGFVQPTTRYSYEESRQQADELLAGTTVHDKWFSEKAKQDLALVKHCILQLPRSEYREFFTLAFLAIIRRTSVAYDGEIRPHVNKEKTPRPVLKAFTKKVNDMITREKEWVEKANSDIWADAVIGDNRVLAGIPLIQDNPVGLIIAHPPYLNSFDYLPVFSLEFRWAEGFPELWNGRTMDDIRAMESKSWPATNEKIYKSYFDDQRKMLEQCFEVVVNGGVCAVVVGDATIRKELVPVLANIADIGQEVGFRLEEIIYRTTHYGVGKYAYNFRADYHDNGGGKKDGVLIFRKC